MKNIAKLLKEVFSNSKELIEFLEKNDFDKITVKATPTNSKDSRQITIDNKNDDEDNEASLFLFFFKRLWDESTQISFYLEDKNIFECHIGSDPILSTIKY